MAGFLQKISSLQKLDEMQETLQNERKQLKGHIAVCGDTGCSALGSKNAFQVFKDYLEEKELAEVIKLKSTGCLGLCECGPVVFIYPDDIFYQKISAEDVPEIIEKTVLKGEVIDRLLYECPQTGQKYVSPSGMPFYNKQYRTLLEGNWNMDPLNIKDYLAVGGYKAAGKALWEMSREEVVNEIKDSQLRGRGGAGFPTGRKWEEAYEAYTSQKYIICNADEGDPGAFMDRSILEGNPHSILEGMIIGGYAIGANKGYIYIRAEYPSALEKLRIAINQASELGLLGNNIFGSGFDFEISISIGAGAFVCGETSALVASIEGKVGEPRQKPPHLATRGLWQKPTVVNNVETFANVPHIINQGAVKYSQVGTAKSTGTKIFSLVGKVNNTGLVEVPMGIPLREIIFDIGGGIREDKNFKAVQTGGPSGGCIPEFLLDTPTDYDELAEVGSIMGSGGMIVMDDETCMVSVARYFLNFLKEESCGKCFSCREGISRMLELVDTIMEGNGSEVEFMLLQELAHTVKEASMCGLGQTAANPVLSTIRYFDDEYAAHIHENKCPAGTCKALIKFTIDKDLCNGCRACVKSCPGEAIEGDKESPHVIIQDKCTKCGICMENCKQGAVIKI